MVVDPINLMAFGDSVYCDESDAPLFIGADCENCDENMIEWSLDENFDVIEGTGPILENQNNPGNPLNEGIYYVRVVDTTGCSELDSVVLFLDLILLVEPLDPIEICIGDTVFILIEPPLESDSLEWIWEGDNIIYTDNPNEIFAFPTESQFYIYTVINENGCEAKDSLLVNVVDIGNVVATADPEEICIYFSTQLNVNNIPGATYIWSNGETLDDPTIHNPVAEPLETTTYDVIVTDEDSGCATVSSVTVTVVHPACEEPYVFFPNAFTPNGDGHNDELCLRGSDVTEVHFIIYNRWGEKMFESNSQDECWDGTFAGKELGADAYGYYLRVRCGNGEEFIKKGNVTILK
jgi:gliding motility-associated-like protein